MSTKSVRTILRIFFTKSKYPTFRQETSMVGSQGWFHKKNREIPPFGIDIEKSNFQKKYFSLLLLVTQQLIYQRKNQIHC